MTDLFCQLKRLRHDFECFSSQQAKYYDVEHLSGPQGMTVIYLYHHQKEEIFVKDIMKQVKISKSVASSLMNRMEKNCFVQLLPSEKDKRLKRVVLTDLGISKAKKLEAFFQIIQDSMLEGISQEDLATTIRVIGQIQTNLRKGVNDD
ncbi:MarR family winged helix-turn-helix transcriptional regulator [Streptococcus sp. sy004]|uniref:MarR family winged helix-turn-helix transcriptional regulator n=1 Tax=Streptococcus sp. sy004 TaxID=2600149 RepID=UPI0011B7A404|nr:MarR family winged helix-turn-helix transcriptional regulator [Streptococcus sp. sy004]TWT12421.1 winged helix-turn-helix transcriptional regulator [Streptococcus sp. sy004]